MTGIPTPLRAIRHHCLDCVGQSSHEVDLCPARRCPVHPLRFGKRPSPEERASLAVDHAMVHPGERHYVCVCDDITLMRVIGGALAGKRAKQLGDHHDLRRSNLQVVKSGREVHQDRPMAVARAIEALNSFHSTKRKAAKEAGREYREMISAERLRWLLEMAFAVLDRVSLGGR